MRIKWGDTKPSETLPEYAEVPAYIVNKKLSIIHKYYLNGGFEAESFKSESKRIKLLNEEAVKEYSDLAINIETRFKFESVDARTIKKNGKIIPVGDEDILIKNFIDPVDQEQYWQVRFSLKNVEVGDEVEYLVSYKNSNLSGANFVFMNEDLPIAKNTVILKVKKGLETMLYSKNGLGQPAKKTDDLYDTFTWQLENLEGYSNTHNSDKYSNLPHCYYYLKRIFIPAQMSMPYNIGLENWTDLKKRYEEVYNDNAKRRGFKEIVEFVDDSLEAKGVLPEDKLEAFVNYINNEFEILDDLPSSESSQPFSKFFNSKRIDRDNLIMFYEAVIETIGLDCDYVFARNKYAGPILFDIVSAGQITTVGLGFKDSKGTQRLLFTGSGNVRYKLDEIPFTVQGTKAVLISKIDKSRNFKSSSIMLTQSGANENIVGITMLEKVKIDHDSSDFECVVTLKGAFSILNRHKALDLLEEGDKKEIAKYLLEDFSDELNVKSVELISNIEDQKESDLRIKISGSKKSYVQKIEDGVYALQINKSVDHTKVFTKSDERKLDYLPYYCYIDRFNVNYQFDKEIQFESLNKNQYSENIGPVNTDMTVYSGLENNLVVQSSYAVLNSVISAEQYEKLKELHAKFENVRNNDVIFTIK